MHLYEFTLSTAREGLYDITGDVTTAVHKSGVDNGVCLVYCPHTTAGITINENSDPTVKSDFLLGMAKAFPDRAEFRHAEGNSAAHLKASCVGASSSVIIAENRLFLGIWQAVYFCEFDGPRQRRFFVKIQ